ncbi:polysaccharide lyase family 8 super-sandwich domain-containing protein [Paenibacillus sp. IITD108]|uniref:polysaccharide lyase family 8 super-sandwich domain-containing protein n=1 Tax=Paenibacillus sp. IITD108 TaxID=3116649 RepID=UPI002F3E5347
MIRKSAMLSLILLLILTLLPQGNWSSMTAEAAGSTYLHLDFDNYSLEPSTAGPASTAGGGGNWSFFDTVAGTDYAFGQVFPDKAGRSFTMVSNTTGKNLNTQKSNLTIPGDSTKQIVVMEGRFLFDTITHERRLFYANLTKQPDTAVLGYVTVIMDAQGSMKLEYPAPDGKKTLMLGSYEPNSWYHIQVYMDLHNKQLQLYVNGEQLAENVQLIENWDNLRHFRFTQIGKTGEQGQMTLDDIKVYDYSAVESVALSETALQLSPGDQRQLLASVLPADATNTYLIWYSDDPAVAAVDEKGMVTAVANGSTTIYAASKENSQLLGTAAITVDTYVPVEGVTVNPAAAEVQTDRTISLEAVITPEEATNKAVEWTSSDPEIATVDSNGTVYGLTTGTVNITASSLDGGHLGESTITVIARNTPAESIELPMSIRVVKGDKVKLTPVFYPADTTNREVQWSSEDDSIAIVDSSGVITGLEAGTTVIRASVTNGSETVQAETTVEVAEAKLPKDEFDEMRLRWKSMLDGGPLLNTSHQDINNQVQAANTSAQKLWDSMITDGNTAALWPDILPSTTDSSYFNTYLTRLRDMSYAYSMQGGSLYHNYSLLQAIKYGMDWVYENAYNEHTAEFGNWWNFDIGAPLRAMDILVMLYDEMSSEEIDRYVRTADHFIGDIMSPSFNSTGANRSDIMTIEAVIAILTKDGSRLDDVLVQLRPLFIYVTEGDGFYEDGSYIQHGTIPYTGSYGEVLIRGIGNLFYLLKDTAWEVTDPNAVNVYRWIYESVAPVIYRGETMDMIRGRAIAREALSGHQATIGIMSGMIRLAMAAPEADAKNFKQMMKHWVLTTDAQLNVYKALRLDLIEPLEAIMNDASLIPAADTPAHYEFGAMNRTVHIQEDFAIGISKSSRRIATYELTNGENGEGWYTGDGMTYLYTKDATQFADDFWATVNRYRLPGTTVDTRPRKNDHYQYGDGETTPSNNWAGGAVLGSDGISGMNLQQVGTTLSANKSWFMFGDKIVALGSGITSKDNRTIETIVEQRKLNEAGNNALTIDGTLQPDTLGWSNQTSGTEWIHLQGNVSGSDIGYYFPDKPVLQASRATNSGTWYAINQNDSASKDVRTRNYLSIWFDHGKNPVNDTYSYVLLPNRTAAETEKFANSPSIEIIENSPEAHAVADRATNQTGINFWKDAVKTVAGVTSNRQASVMLKEAGDDTLEMVVADPTFVNTGIIEIEIDRSAAAVIEADEQIFVTQLHPTIKFNVSTGSSLSKSFHVKFDLDPAKERPDPEQDIPSLENVKQPPAEEVPIAHVHASFDQEKLGNQPQGWTIKQAGNTIATVASPEGGEDYALRLVDRNNAGAAVASTHFPAQESFINVAWTFADMLGASGSKFQWLQGDQTAIELELKDNRLYWNDGQGNSHLIKEAAPANWHTAKLQADIANQRWDLWLDGELVVVQGAFKQSLSAIDHMQIQTGYAEDNVWLYVDDVTVFVTGAVPLIAEEFETYETGGSPGDWIVVENKNNAPVYIVYDEDERNKSVLMDDQNTSFRATIKKMFAPQSGRFIAQWRYKELGGGKYPEFQLLNQAAPVIRLSSSSNNYLRYYGPGASANSTAEKAKTKIGAWHTVKLDVDTEKQTYDIYFDGQLVEQGLGFYAPATQIDGILFGSAYSAADAPLYIDSVKVYAFDSEAPEWESSADLAFSEVTSSSVRLQWPAAADNIGIGSYAIFQNDTLAAAVSGNQSEVTISSLKPSTSYNFAVYAVDQSGNRSALPLAADMKTLASPVQPPIFPDGNAGGGNGTGEAVNEAVLNADLIKKYLQQGKAVVKAGEYQAKLPAQWLAWLLEQELPQFAKAQKLALEQVQVIVQLGKAAEELSPKWLEAIQQQYGSPAAAMARLEVTLRNPSSGEQKLVSMPRGYYAEYSLPLDERVDLSRLSVVQWNEASGEFVFVPVSFETVNGVKKAIIKSSNTGWFAIVQLPSAAASFSDIKGHWAEEAIALLASKQLLKGMSAASFAPEQSLSRAQLSVILVRALGLYAPSSEKAAFSDVNGEEWFAEALNIAVESGLITGYQDNSFRPHASVSREEMTVMIVRALQLAGYEADHSDAKKSISDFADASDIQPWARSSAELLVQAGIINGVKADQFMPQAELTRAQMAIILERMMQMLKFI